MTERQPVPVGIITPCVRCQRPSVTNLCAACRQRNRELVAEIEAKERAEREGKR